MRGDKPTDERHEVLIESIDLEARGVARLPAPDGTAGGKVVFVDGALPGEHVRIASYRRKSSYELAQIDAMLRPSAARVTPRCAHFGVCGGCSMQHLDASAQLANKQRVLEDTLQHIGKLRPELVLRPIQGPDWHYRFRARLSVRHVPKKGGVLVGFHERRSSYVADMRECHVLPPHVARLLVPLRTLVEGLSIRDRLPQIEYAQGERVTVLVLRVLEPPNADDGARLRAFADAHGVQFWLQSKGPDTAVPFHPLDAPALSYTLPEFAIDMPFRPTDFTQVNHAINRVLVSRAVTLLDPQPGDAVLDLFCGLGNFTLPLARHAQAVLGVEGSEALLARARENAAHNGLSNARFLARNLFEVTREEVEGWGRFDRWLVDPPREGGLAIAQAAAALTHKPKRIVYVSCNPATLARDAAVLVHEGGYALRAAGVVNMFPHTSHVESMAVFEPVAGVAS